MRPYLKKTKQNINSSSLPCNNQRSLGVLQHILANQEGVGSAAGTIPVLDYMWPQCGGQGSSEDNDRRVKTALFRVLEEQDTAGEGQKGVNT